MMSEPQAPHLISRDLFFFSSTSYTLSDTGFARYMSVCLVQDSYTGRPHAHLDVGCRRLHACDRLAVVLEIHGVLGTVIRC